MPNGKEESTILCDSWLRRLDVWKSGQVLLHRVPRWRQFREFCGKKGVALRPQTTLQHTHGFSVFMRMVMVELRPYVRLDEDLLARAVEIHDHGEGEVGVDVSAVHKTDNDDLAEYNAFVRRFRPLPDELFLYFEEAFILQFCCKDMSGFPDDVQRKAKELFHQRRHEAVLFHVMEHFDYFMYVLEQYLNVGATEPLYEVLNRSTPMFELAIQEIPGFGTVIWPPTMQAWSAAFVADHQGCALPE